MPHNPAPQQLAPPSPWEMREELTHLILKDLLGPAGGPEEELPERETRVSERYLVGGLAPDNKNTSPFSLLQSKAGSGHSADHDGDLDELPDESELLQSETLAVVGADSPEDGPTDKESSLVDTLLPSSIGYSFVVDAAEEAIAVQTSWGRYERVRSNQQTADSGSAALVWKRVPVVNEPYILHLREGSGDEAPAADFPLVRLYWRIRRHQSGNWFVTLFLCNGQEKEKPFDSRWIFQVELAVASADGRRRPVFVQRQEAVVPLETDTVTREEIEGHALRYRHTRIFAAGHGVAVITEREETDEPHRARGLRSSFLPQADVPGQTPRTAEDDLNIAGIVLDMAELADMPVERLAENFRTMTSAYAAWIASLKNSSAVTGQTHASAAAKAVSEAEIALARMEEGIQTLENNPKALQAFRFANEAMRRQRLRSILARIVRKGENSQGVDRDQLMAKLNIPANRSWRLFQIAFVLLNLPSITDPLHLHRSHPTEAVADLLWFATGGGKTEAYLGLTAYTLALRRLQDNLGGYDAMHGVGVFMRYTLRLLTLQQFQRAAALICACELLRRDDPHTWGGEPFRLGLWVGSRTTPNTLAQAQDFLARERKNQAGGYGSPVQFTSCPWCGAPVTINTMDVRNGISQPGRCHTFCGDSSGLCPFSKRQSPQEGLPVMVVDEEIYRRPPSLLIATVDKFAQMPWRGEAQMLFGKVCGVCERHGFISPDVKERKGDTHRGAGSLPPARVKDCTKLRPPDLIIQDELHLISGPLGSLVGLYENAVDTLCEWSLDEQTVRPKIIASTATTRRSEDQIRKLFLRRAIVFPPQGIDSRDNFFALERTVAPEQPGRRYLGICATGRRIPAATIRVYTAAMSAAQLLFEKYGDAADPWMTLLGYFNSIRELAGTRRLVEDDIRARLRDAHERFLGKRLIRRVEELTSRQSSQNIPTILSTLELPFRSQPTVGEMESAIYQPKPYDVVLATNMISVGVDIDRLGLMVVSGQPKTTAEYIQATSRVGRAKDAPGLVLTIYNWARPRDMSHYESFIPYHMMFHRHVEALSVTPFSSRALDRGLAGVFISLMRHLAERLNANGAAHDFQAQDNLYDQVLVTLLHRVKHITESQADEKKVRDMLAHRRDRWLQMIRHAQATTVCYCRPEGHQVPLLKKPESGKPWQAFTCSNSLRDVEGVVNLLLEEDGYGLQAYTKELP